MYDTSRVYRIEHLETHLGPFNNGDEVSYDIEAETGVWIGSIPGAREIFPEFTAGIHYSGFPNLETLLKWFPKETHKTLQDAGYYVAVFETATAKHHHTQSMFMYRHDHKPVMIYDFDELKEAA
jgi:hypothetical protein